MNITEKRILNRINFITKARAIHQDKYDYKNVIYKNNKTKVKIICPIHGLFSQTPDHHINKKQNCKKCSILTSSDKQKGIKRKPLSACFFKTKEELYKALVKSDINDKYSYYVDDIKKSKGLKAKIKIRCKLHGDFYQIPYNHIFMKQGCPECATNNRKEKLISGFEEFKRKANIVHNYKYIYNDTNYINNKTRIVVTCIKHGPFSCRPDNHIGSRTGCPICKSSKGELKLLHLLKELKLKPIRQFEFTNNKFKYDFCIESLKLLIEYDGELHFKSVPHFGGVETLNNIKRNDFLKDKLALEKGYTLIRVAYPHFANLERFFLLNFAKIFKYSYRNRFLKNIDNLDVAIKKKVVKIEDTKIYKKYIIRTRSFIQ